MFALVDEVGKPIIPFTGLPQVHPVLVAVPTSVSVFSGGVHAIEIFVV
jgi:hypothetical protein